ncbi:MAG TPA: 50S ribosomal protein L25 [Blastocatellia bacterium]|jgi:large subunit ribosomal protein L25|nr:50S ribosomal protein L25 [Blastocatellia bacterium]
MSLDRNISLEAKPRSERGKNASRRQRAQGLIPITVYGGGKETASANIVKREFAALLRGHGRNVIFTLSVDGAATPVKIADMQVDPVKGTLIHMDLMRISLTEKSKFETPIRIVGEAEGVKTLGGVLEVVTHSLEVRCLPGDLPSFVEVDVTPMSIGDKIKVGDLKLDSKIEVLDDPETMIVTVTAPRAEEPAPEVTPEAAAEPEVIKKGKGEEAE